MNNSKRLKILFLFLLFIFIFTPQHSLAKDDIAEVDAFKNWVITFNDEISNSNLNSLVFVKDSKGSLLDDITLTILPGGRFLNVSSPVEGYKDNEVYTLTVTQGVQSKNNKKLRGTFVKKYVVKSLRDKYGSIFPDKNLIKVIGNNSINSLTQISYTVDTRYTGYRLDSYYDDPDIVTDLTGVEKVVNLEKINLDKTKITDLTPLSKNINLQYISLNDSLISDLTPIKNMKNLEYLSLKNNNISDLTPLKDLSKLQTLILDGNNIRDLSPLKDLPNLQYLSLTENQISSLDCLKSLPKLKTIFVKNNPLKLNDSLSYLHDKTENKDFELKKEGNQFKLIVNNYDDLMFAIFYDIPFSINDPSLKATYSEAQRIISNLIDPSMTEFDKELAIHDYLVINIQYDRENYNAKTIPDVSHTAYGALINKIAVCDGYAQAANLLLNMVDVESKLVTGIAGEFHQWNIVKIDGDYYYLDVTFDDLDDGKISYKYFNLSDNQIKGSRLFHEKIKAKGYKYNYDYYFNSKANNTELESSRKVYGKVKLPNGEVNPSMNTTVQLYLYSNSIKSGNNGDGYVTSASVSIPAGKSETEYSMIVPYDSKKYTLVYFASMFEGNYSYKGYYSTNGTVADEKNKTLITAEDDINANITLLKGITISGKLSLPNGDVAPLGGLKLNLSINSNKLDDIYFGISKEIIIPEGQNYAPFSFEALSSGENYSLNYFINKPNGSYSYGYYSESGATIDNSNVTLVNKDTGNINFVIAPNY